MNYRFWLGQFVVLLLLASGVAIPAAQPQPRFDALVREDFCAGLAGDTARFEHAMTMLEEMLAKDPHNAEITSWHGAGVFYRSNAAFQKGDMQGATKLVQAGVAEMAEAVRLAPDDPGVRISRGAVLIAGTRYMQPPMASRLLEVGVDDFEAVLRLQKAKLDQLSIHSKGELLIGLADGWNRLGKGTKAGEYFERIASDTQLRGSVYGEKARAWLKDAPEARAPTFFNCAECHRRVDLTVPDAR